MKLSEVKKILSQLHSLVFQLPNGTFVPKHFHVTEIGEINKNFIDCGGSIRKEKRINFQLWNANDYNHRLHPEKLIQIIQLAEKVLNIGDYDIEIEHQGNTIEKFGLDFNGTYFILTNKETTCLAREKCSISKEKVNLSDLKKTANCTPGESCC